MNKNEFLKYLEKRFEVLNEKERDDILNEYSQHIDMKIQSGLSEEEAIKDFGDISELADDILSAYNVDPNYKKSGIDSAKVGKTIHSGASFVKNTFDKIGNYEYTKTTNGIFKVIMLCIRIGVLLFILPYFLCMLFSVAALGVLIVFLFMGYPCIGFTIGCLGFNMCAGSLLAAILKLVYFTKYKLGGENNEVNEIKAD